MRLRLDLTCGQWRVIECDGWSLDGALTRFVRDGRTVLIAPTNYFELIRPLPQATSARPDPQREHFSLTNATLSTSASASF
jgi:hypothetical protein